MPPGSGSGRRSMRSIRMRPRKRNYQPQWLPSEALSLKEMDPRARVMSANAEARMSGLKRLWSRIAGIVDLHEHMGDPTGDYLFSLEKRIARLERHLERLE